MSTRLSVRRAGRRSLLLPAFGLGLVATLGLIPGAAPWRIRPVDTAASPSSVSAPASAPLAVSTTESSPPEASPIFSSVIPGAPPPPFSESRALAWANADPAAAVAWARGLSNPDERSSALAAIAGELARAEPLEALLLALPLDPGPARDTVLRTAVAEWAAQDSDGAVRWVWEVNDAGLRQDLLAAVIVQVAERDPSTAALMAEDDLAPGRMRDDVFVSVLQRWAQQDAPQARKRLAALPAGELKDAAVSSGVGSGW